MLSAWPIAAGRPFDPDTASEWWKVGIGAVTATGTLPALLSFAQLRDPRESLVETRRRVQAEKRLAAQSLKVDRQRKTDGPDYAERGLPTHTEFWATIDPVASLGATSTLRTGLAIIHVNELK